MVFDYCVYQNYSIIRKDSKGSIRQCVFSIHLLRAPTTRIECIKTEPAPDVKEDFQKAIQNGKQKITI